LKTDTNPLQKAVAQWLPEGFRIRVERLPAYTNSAQAKPTNLLIEIKILVEELKQQRPTT